uniref:Uncharacterized protein n=1 Tax=Anguilla anguilla TaxID=7936 RepID=A0A0E9V9Z3_ANGAN
MGKENVSEALSHGEYKPVFKHSFVFLLLAMSLSLPPGGRISCMLQLYGCCNVIFHCLC